MFQFVITFSLTNVIFFMWIFEVILIDGHWSFLFLISFLLYNDYEIIISIFQLNWHTKSAEKSVNLYILQLVRYRWCNWTVAFFHYPITPSKQWTVGTRPKCVSPNQMRKARSPMCCCTFALVRGAAIPKIKHKNIQSNSKSTTIKSSTWITLTAKKTCCNRPMVQRYQSVS